MSKAKHTPGPWTVEEQTKAQYDSESGERLRDRLTTFVKSGDYYVAVVMRSSFIPGVEGNARLIAAAPELLNWAKAYLLLLEGMQVNPSINKGEQFFAHTTLSKLINELSRTIAEAEGDD